LLVQQPERFRARLKLELSRHLARSKGLPVIVRMNVVSDVPWEREWPEFFADFPMVQFMDYTKDISRVLDPKRPSNYHLTFSRSEVNEEECKTALAAGQNVAVVFDKPPYPETFWGYSVVDGDTNDLRFLDPAASVIALSAKAAGARRDTTGFVVKLEPASSKLAGKVAA
jgi:hypothetical protein